jgi:O-acetyl-ADP-ribose deacetylase (regulator of RNase III)
MIELVHGDLLAAPVEALVNAVNTVGVMGKGIALQFRQKYPDMFVAYEAACRAGTVRIGHMRTFDRGPSAENARSIINFPTKRHWCEPSRLADVESGLIAFTETVQRLEIRSLAVPPLGCGLGGLDWREVQPRIESAFANLEDVRVLLYAPTGVSVPTKR